MVVRGNGHDATAVVVNDDYNAPRPKRRTCKWCFTASADSISRSKTLTTTLKCLHASPAMTNEICLRSPAADNHTRVLPDTSAS